METRAVGYACGLAGFSLIYSKGNDLARHGMHKLGIDSRHAERITDAAYGGVFSYIYGLGLYSTASQMPLSQANKSAMAAVVISLPAGMAIGYCTNLWRDGFEINNPDGKPTFLRGATKKKRMTAVALSAILGLGIAGGVYASKPYLDYSLEQIVQK